MASNLIACYVYLRIWGRSHRGDLFAELQNIKNRNKETNAANRLMEESDEEYEDPGFNQNQRLILHNAEEMAASREKEIHQISQSINDLGLIFRDMHQMVIVQGTVLDRIDCNIDKVVTYTAEAERELIEVGSPHKNKNKKQKTKTKTKNNSSN